MLQADVDRELQRLLALLQDVVEAALDAGEALVVHAAIADDVGNEIAVGIDAAFLALELETGHAQPVDLELLPRRRMALEPDEAAVRGPLGAHLSLAELGQHPAQLGG